MNLQDQVISAYISKIARSADSTVIQRMEEDWDQYLWSLADQIIRAIFEKKQELTQKQQQDGAPLDESVLIGLDQKRERLTDLLEKLEDAFSEKGVREFADEISSLSSSVSLKGMEGTPQLQSSAETIEESFRQLAENIGKVLNYQGDVLDAFNRVKGSLKKDILEIQRQLGALEDQEDTALDEEQQMTAVYNAIEEVQPGYPISEYLTEDEIRNLNPQTQEAELDLENENAFIHKVMSLLNVSEVFLPWAQQKFNTNTLKKLVREMKPRFPFVDEETWKRLENA